MVRSLKSILSKNTFQQRRLQTNTFSSLVRRQAPLIGISNELSSNLTTSSSSSPPPPQQTRKLQHFLSGTTQLRISDFVRSYSSSLDTSEEVNQINLKFAEARDDIESALESKETVYFNEEAECAWDSVKEVLDMFQGLLEKLPEGERGSLRRSMGLKMEQLKAELDQLNE